MLFSSVRNGTRVLSRRLVFGHLDCPVPEPEGNRTRRLGFVGSISGWMRERGRIRRCISGPGGDAAAASASASAPSADCS